MDGLTVPFQKMLESLVAGIPKVIAALVIFLVGLYFAGLVSKMVKRLLSSRKVDHELTLFITKVTHWTIIVLAIVIALQQVGFDVTTFLAGLGILGFTIGFALQDVSKNFIAGMLLLLQQPFEIGDVIEVADYIGTVQDVDLRATELRTFDGKYVLIPNTDVFTNPITNYSREPVRRIDITVGIAYNSDLNRAKEIVLNVISGLSGVVEEPAPQVVYTTFNSSTIDFTLYFWVDTRKQGLMAAKDEAIVKINDAFLEQGIEIPYPTQTILMQSS